MRRLALALLLAMPGALALAPVALAQAPDRAAVVGMLLDDLRTAPSEAAATALESRIRTLWLNGGTPAVTLLMGRALRELGADQDAAAEDDLTAILALQPDFAEATSQRALARFHQGNYPGAVADIEATVQHEPRNFDAFRNLSRFAESQGDWKGAYAAWQKLMAIDPQTAGGAKRLEDLRRRALGEEM